MSSLTATLDFNGVGGFFSGNASFNIYKRPDILGLYKFQKQMAIETFNRCKFLYTGGPIAGYYGWQAGGGSDYAGGMTIRDAVMMVLAYPAYFTTADLVRILTAIVYCQGVVDDGVQTALMANGTVVGYGASIGSPSDYDNACYGIILACVLARRKGNAEDFLANETALLAGYNFIPVSNHLAFIDPSGDKPVGWGFEDSEFMTGKVSSLSVLRGLACRCLVEMYQMEGMTSSASPHVTELAAIKSALVSDLLNTDLNLLVFGTDGTNGNSPLLNLNASVYAATTGMLSTEVKQSMSLTLRSMLPGGVLYRQGYRGFRNGQLPHAAKGSFSSFRNFTWPYRKYQNQAEWAVMAGAGMDVVAETSFEDALQINDDWAQQNKGQLRTVRPVEATNWPWVSPPYQAPMYGASNQPFQWLRKQVDGDTFDM